MNKKFLKNLKYYITNILELVIFVIICYILLESIKFGSFTNYFKLASSILITGSRYIFTSILIILGFTLIIRSITKNKFICNLVISIILLSITLISFYKYAALEQPFVPYDILLVGNLNQISEFGFTGISIQMVISLMLLCMFLLISYYINTKNNEAIKISIIERIIIFIIGIVIIFFTCISPNRYKNFSIKNDNGDNYVWMGANGVFFMHLGDFYNPKPHGYNEKTIEEIRNKYNNLEENSNVEKPNIILIMNESYADLSKLSNVTYSQNPMEIINNMEETEKNFLRGNIVSPVLGGGTSLPEFEVLTGLTSYYLEQQIYPYTSYINGDMNSIVREFNKNNYTTIGIHTNTKTFYNRYNIYKFLGFEKTIFEEDIQNPEYKGNYISDNETANQIINAFENNDGNKFIFTVTMQNHMKYINKEYDNYDIEVSSTTLTKNEVKELKKYTQGIVDANKMYEKIVKYLKTKDEPTILVMFGDHLPLLGDDYCSTYKKNNLSLLEYYTTPCIVWANYDIENKELPTYLCTSNLGLNIMDIANIELPWYLKPFKQLYERYPVINNKFIIDKTYKFINEGYIESKELIDNCKILQYDLLIKNKYIEV